MRKRWTFTTEERLPIPGDRYVGNGYIGMWPSPDEHKIRNVITSPCTEVQDTPAPSSTTVQDLWVVAELETRADYGEEGVVEYREIGQIYGPYTSEEEAHKAEKLLSRMSHWSYWETRKLV